MKKNGIKITLSLGLGAVLFSGINLEAISLNEAVSKAVENHPSVKIANENIRAKAQDIDVAKSGYYPKLDLNINYGNENKRTKAEGETEYTKRKYSGGYHAEAVATQNIFKGFYDSSNVKVAKAGVMTSEFEKQSEIEKLSFSVASTYFEIIRLRNTLVYEEMSIKKYDEYYTLAKKKSRGTGQRGELLIVDTKLKKAQSDYIKHSWELQAQNEKFFQLVGEYPDDNMSLQTLDFIKKESLAEALVSMNSKNSQLQGFTSKVVGKKAEQRRAKSGYLPSLDLEVKAYYDEDIESFKTDTKQNSAMLKLRYNLFNGLQDKALIEKQRVEQLKTKAEYNKKRVELQENLRSNYALYISSEKRVKTLFEYVSSQEELTVLYQKEFKLGKRTIVNLVDAQQDLKNARIDYINTLTSMVKSTYNIAYAKGGLNELISNSELSKVDVLALNKKKVAKKTKQVVLKNEIVKVSDNKPKTILSRFQNAKKGAYTISTATFINKKNAQRFIDENFKDKTEVLSFSIKNYTKIVYGLFDTKQEARKALKKFINSSKNNTGMSVKTVEMYKRFL